MNGQEAFIRMMDGEIVTFNPSFLSENPSYKEYSSQSLTIENITRDETVNLFAFESGDLIKDVKISVLVSVF